jgi:broad specificity phosphatase PhoE
MTTRVGLVMVRHGETVGNSSVRYYGRTDLALSDLGRAQMRAARVALAHRFGMARFSPVVSSPLIRAAEGARIIAGPTVEVVEIDEFREVDFGDFEGLTAEEIEVRWPAEFVRWNRDRLDPGYAYPNGESRAAFKARVGRGVTRMMKLLDAERTADCPAILVAHRGVIRAITYHLAGVEPLIELGSIHLLARHHASGWAPEVLDFTEHLGTAIVQDLT